VPAEPVGASTHDGGHATRCTPGLSWALAGVAAAASLALIVWGASPAGNYLHHARDSNWRSVLLFDVGWTLMTLAMMLPTTTRLFRAFQPVAARHARTVVLMVAVGAAFVAVWALLGHFLRSVDTSLHSAVAGWNWPEEHAHLVAAVVFVVAGVYQWTPLKHRCLTKCRTPLSFVYGHWRGSRPLLDAVAIGFAYGVSCVGCCWALMVLLFAVGSGNVAWMLVLGGLMAAEKNMKGGTRITTPLGVVLLVFGLFLALGVGPVGPVAP
jgi:predicted metal-binding membrane protein